MSLSPTPPTPGCRRVTASSLSQHPHLDTLLHTLLCLVIVLPLSSARSLALLSYSSVAGELTGTALSCTFESSRSRRH